MNKIRIAALAVVLGCICACSAGDEPPRQASVQQAVGLPNGGFLPVPFFNGKVQWDSTIVDLMAADALAFCAPWWRTSHEDGQETDRYLMHLQGLMNEHSCGPTVSLMTRPWWGLTEISSIAANWYHQRTKEAGCNADPSDDHEPTTVDGSEWDEVAPIDRWDAYNLLDELDAPGTDYTTISWQAKREAAAELGLAGMNLCMAGRLREQMLSADVLIASGDSQRQLLQVIRERAGLALHQFTLLGLAFTNGTSTGTPTASHQILPALRLFASATEAGFTRTPRLGREFARSLRFYVDATEELAEFIARTASARSDLSELGGHETRIARDATWSDASWRGRLLNVFYGGDPLGGPISLEPYDLPALADLHADGKAAAGISSTFAPGTGPSFPWASLFPHATTRIEAPEVATLLGLARQADALWVAYDFGGGVTATRDFIYRAVEAKLRSTTCARETPMDPCVVPANDPAVMNTTTNYNTAYLWKQFRITPDHAMKLAELLYEMFLPTTIVPNRSSILFSGIFEFKAQAPQYISTPFTRWLHVDPKFGAADAPASMLASRYHANAGAFIPNADLIPLASARLQGFVLRRSAAMLPFPIWYPFHAGADNTAARHMGAVPLLAAVRDGLLRAKRKADTAGTGPTGYFDVAQDMMQTIQGAIGSVSYSVRPETEAINVTRPAGSPAGGCHVSNSCLAILQKVNTTKVKVLVDIIRPTGSPAAEIVKVDRQTLTAAAKSTDHMEQVANVALAEYSAGDYNNTTNQNGNLTRANLDALPGVALASTGSDTLGLTHQRATIEWENPTNPPAVFPNLPQDAPVLLLRTTATPRKYVVLADGTGLGSVNATASNSESRVGSSLPVIYSTDGKYGSVAGSFNAKVSQVWASQMPDFAKPAFDAFGVPTRWIPPASPDLFGGNEGEDSVAYYLRTARSAADDATAAVRFALEAVISEKADLQRLRAQRERSEGIRKLEIAQLCGREDGCPIEFSRYFLQANLACQKDEDICLALALALLRHLPVFDGYTVLKPVADALTPGIPSPTFGQYAGGELETLALKQWTSVRALERAILDAGENLRAMKKAAKAADTHAASIQQQLDDQNYLGDIILGQATRTWEAQCGRCTRPNPTPATDACCITTRAPIEVPDIVSGITGIYGDPGCAGMMGVVGTIACPNSGTGTTTIPGDDCVDAWELATEATTSISRGDDTSSTSVNNGPIGAQRLACHQATIALANATGPLGVNQASVNAALDDAATKHQEMWSTLSTNVSKIMTAADGILLAAAEISRAVSASKLAEARVKLDAIVEQTGFASQLTLSRRYHHYDFWRARALLEDARRLSAAARRAIEGRFAVDLSEMDGNEPFVAAPALWADEVYEYDLDPPAAVGLSIVPTATKDGLYPNKLSDYVRNLENFVRGYSVKRPTATAVGDAEVLTIPGPELIKTLSGGGSKETIVSGGSNAWTFQCKDGDPWTTNPAAATPGKALINWSFLKNPSAPFENEGYGSPLNLNIFSGSFGDTAVALGGKALNFNGTSELNTVQPTTVGEATAGISMFTWVNLRSYHTASSYFVTKVTGTTPDWISVSLLENKNAAMGPGYWEGVVNIGGPNHDAIPLTNAAHKIPLNQWVQIGMTFDGWVARLYKNGAEVSNRQLVPPQDPPKILDWGNHQAWKLGAGVNGWIGPTTVDNTVYTAQQIAADYKKTIAYTKPSLAWQFTKPADEECTFDAAVGCSLHGCGCISNHCSGGSCPEVFDFNAGSAGPLPLTLGAGTGTATIVPAEYPEFWTPSGRPSVFLDGAKSLITGVTKLGESPAEITLSAWVYVQNATPGVIHFISRNYNLSTWASPWTSVFLGESSTGTLRAAVNVGGTNREINVAGVPRDQWAHVAMTFDGTNVRVFLNGVEKAASAAVPGAPARIDWGPTDFFNSHGPWFVGGNAQNGAEFLQGLIGDVHIEPRARSTTEIADLFHRGVSGSCSLDDACVGTMSCCRGRTESSPLRTMCDGTPPKRAKISFELDPWGRQNDYYGNPPYTERHNVRWGRLAVNLVGAGVRDCSRASNPSSCYVESFLRYNLLHTGPTWASDYNGKWVPYGLPIAQVEGGKALAIEEWIDPVVNGWNQPTVMAVERHELRERPIGGAYELELQVTPDVRLDRIENVQLLMETDYWVRQR